MIRRFLRFFSKFKNMTFYIFSSCCTRFLEHLFPLPPGTVAKNRRGRHAQIFGWAKSATRGPRSAKYIRPACNVSQNPQSIGE